MQIVLIGIKSEKTYVVANELLVAEGFTVYTTEVEESVDAVYDDFKQTRDTIIASDLVVADVSVFEPLTRYQLALALQFRRPTLLIVPAKHERLADLLAIKDRNLTTETYRSNDELAVAMAAFVKETKNSLDAKLFMNIPPSMNKYLDWVATHTRFNKSDVLRDAVEAVADKDTEYQAFLKSLDS